MYDTFCLMCILYSPFYTFLQFFDHTENIVFRKQNMFSLQICNKYEFIILSQILIPAVGNDHFFNQK